MIRDVKLANLNSQVLFNRCAILQSLSKPSPGSNVAKTFGLEYLNRERENITVYIPYIQCTYTSY